MAGPVPQQFHLPFARGLDTKTDPKQVSVNTPLVLQNAVFTNPEEIEKRFGYAQIATISAGNSASNFNDELILTDGFNVKALSVEESAAYSAGKQTAVDLSTNVIAGSSSGAGITAPNAAYDSVSGLICYAWTGVSGRPTVAVIDHITGSPVLNTSIVENLTGGYSGTLVRLIGTKFVIIYFYTNNAGLNELKYSYVDTSAPTVITSGAVIRATISGTHTQFSAQTIGSNLYIAYTEDNTGSPRGRISFLTSALALTLSTTILPINDGWFLNGDASNNVWIFGVRTSTTTLSYNIVASNPNSVVLANTSIDANTTQSNPIATISGSTATVYFYSSTIGASNVGILTRTATLAGSVGSATSFLVGSSLMIGSYPFSYGGVVYFVVLYQSLIQGTGFLVNQDAVVVGKFASAQAGATTATPFSLSTGQYTIPYVSVEQIATISGVVSQQTAYSTATFSFSQPTNHTAAGNNLLLTGALLSMYDGQVAVEKGFLVYPESCGASVSALSGGGIGPGAASSVSTQYVAMYEWIDNRGQLHRSAPSPAGTVIIPDGTAINFTGTTTTGSANITSVSSTTGLIVGQVISGTGIPSGSYITVIVSNTVITISQAATASGGGVSLSTTDTNVITVSFPALALTQKQNVVVSVWRTVGNGTVFYRVSSFLNGVANSTAVITLTYTDSTPDAEILGNDQLYTTGGYIENIVSPGCSAIWNYGTRTLLIDAENPLQVWYSQEIVQELPAEFNDSFTFLVDEQGGPLMCGAQMDDKCILFKNNSIYYMVGNGPSPSGANNNYSTPQLIPSDTGCISPRSVVLIPQGIMYQSNNGIYLLDRSLNTVYLGWPVESYNSATVTSAHLVPGTTQVRFSLSSGVVLMFDYFLTQKNGEPQWSVFLNINAADACIFQDKYTYLTAAGSIQQETPSLYSDNGSFIPLGVSTSWLNLAGIQGYERIWEMLILGTYYSAHTLTATIAINFDPTIVQTSTIPVGSSVVPYQFRVHMKYQRCQSMQITLMETQSGSPGRGLSLSGLAFKFGIKTGLNKLPGAQSYG